ncbi:MAG TPA: hypothetical protein IAA61_00770 [Candidatus Ornithomonoglobus merdipullorum]|uniref:Uncharacterized protein n=1 Tax=Candidatus Ornithomonoglobus merdipullorum TaxID=2840895 RepID=A0A9D1M9U1_9FIRM|nr:hypothetical protein [Candidatus Ornithomonoglobus merdipullorum]
MKKIISSVLAVSVIAASIAMPAMADYSGAGYDVVRTQLTYEDEGTVTNDIDGSNALRVTEATDIFTYPSNGGDCDVFANEFFMSFDFRFDTVDGAVPGVISVNRLDDNGRNGKTGPMFSYSDGQIRTQTGSSSYDDLGAVSPDTWYTVEMEGKMVVSDASVTFRLYGYEDGQKTLINEEQGLNLRQFYAGSANGRPNLMNASNVSIDNVTVISEYPDELVLTSTADSVKAGQTVVMDYTAQRLGAEVTKHPVTWSVYDAENVNPIDDGSVAISADGVLSADIASPSQTVTVRAEATFGENVLTGTKTIEVEAVDTTDEKFDAITIDGAAEVQAGTESTYTVTATKAGEDVTSALEDGDVVWSIYDSANLTQIYTGENAKVTLNNGVLSISDGVLPQTVTLRAASETGLVYGSYVVNIGFSDSQTEEVIFSTSFDTVDMMPSGSNKESSVDGTTAYMTTSDYTVWSVQNYTDYVLTELDVKFVNEGSGFTLMRRDGGKTNTSINYSGGNLATYSGVVLQNASQDKWYHIELLYSEDAADASCNVYEYDENGVLNEDSKVTSLAINMRNGAEYGQLRIANGTLVDNIKISMPVADDVTLTAPSENVFAGGTVQYSATATRNGLPIKNASGLQWEVLDAEGLPLIDGDITVSNTGLVTVGSMVQPQVVTVQVSTANGASDSRALNIQTTEIFKVTNLGINEEGTKIVRMYVDKNFFYNDDVTFIIAIKGSDGMLKGLEMVSGFGDRYVLGANEITVDMDLPDGFDPETDVVETMVWTTF